MTRKTKPNAATLQAFLDWVYEEMSGPTGWAVVNPALEVLRFAQLHDITLKGAAHDRYKEYINQPASTYRLRAIVQSDSGRA